MGVPRFILAERRSEKKKAGLRPKPPAGLSKRERERLARLDEEHAFFVRFVADLEDQWKKTEWKGAAPGFRVLDYRAVSRARAADVIARALDLAYIERVGAGYRTTAKGRRVRDA